MVDDAWWRASGCEGKKQFTSAALAKKAAARQPGRNAYRCKWCGSWHVGHIAKVRSPYQRERRRGDWSAEQV